MRWLFGWKALLIGVAVFSFLAIFVVYYSRDARGILADAVQYVTGERLLSDAPLERRLALMPQEEARRLKRQVEIAEMQRQIQELRAPAEREPPSPEEDPGPPPPPAMEPASPPPEPSPPLPDFIESDEALKTGFEYMAVVGVVGTFLQVIIGLMLKFAALFRWVFTRGL